MFIDEAVISVQGGKGGDGAVTFFPGIKTGPSGGDGGRGGNVYAIGDRSRRDLYPYARKRNYEGTDGKKGENFNRSGAKAEHLFLKVPLGTIFTNTETGEIIEILDDTTEYLVAKGGRGGKGNAAFKSATEQAPRYAKPGKEGEKKQYKLVLRLIADYGLIGLPNAGKSSLLNELTAAEAKIGAYPFTTLEPNLGVFDRFVLADIPGLIEGASSGKGLGIKFLKHIEKVQVILHCIASDSADVEKDYLTVRNELIAYNPELNKKKEIIFLTKSDLVSSEEMVQKKKLLSKHSKEIQTISLYNPQEFLNLQELLKKTID